MDSKQKRKAPVPIQADADHEVVTTPLFKLYQTNPPSKNRSSWRLLELEAVLLTAEGWALKCVCFQWAACFRQGCVTPSESDC
jgi:hypothetical protein